MLTDETEVAEPTHSELMTRDPEAVSRDLQIEQWEAAADHVDRYWTPDPKGQPYWSTLRQLDEFLAFCRLRSPGYTWYIGEDTHGRQRSEVTRTPIEAGYFAPDRIWTTFRAVGISVGEPVRCVELVGNVDNPVAARMRIWDDSLDWVFVEDFLYDQQFDEIHRRCVLDAFEIRLLEERELPVGQITEAWTAIKVLEKIETAIEPCDSILWDEAAAVRNFLAMAPPEHDRATWFKENVRWVPYWVKRDYVQRNILPPVPAQVSELAQLKIDLTLEACGRRDKMAAEALTTGMDLPTWFQDIVDRLARDDQSAIAYVRNLNKLGIINSGEAAGFFSGIVPVFRVGNSVLP